MARSPVSASRRSQAIRSAAIAAFWVQAWLILNSREGNRPILEFLARRGQSSTRAWARCRASRKLSPGVGLFPADDDPHPRRPGGQSEQIGQRDGPAQDIEVVGGSVRPGIARPQRHRGQLGGAVAPHPQRVVTEPVAVPKRPDQARHLGDAGRRCRRPPHRRRRASPSTSTRTRPRSWTGTNDALLNAVDSSAVRPVRSMSSRTATEPTHVEAWQMIGTETDDDVGVGVGAMYARLLTLLEQRPAAVVVDTAPTIPKRPTAVCWMSWARGTPDPATGLGGGAGSGEDR